MTTIPDFRALAQNTSDHDLGAAMSQSRRRYLSNAGTERK